MTSLLFWLLCPTSTVMSFRWELLGPRRLSGLFDKSSIAVLLTQTCGLQAFFLVTQHFGYFSFLSCFYLSKSLLIWNKLTPFWLLSEVFIYKRAAQHGTFDVGCARLNEFTTCCLKISSILCSLAWFSCSLTLAAIQMFPQSFNPFHKYTVRSKAVCFQMNSPVQISVLSLRIHSINSSILDVAVTSSSAVFPSIMLAAQAII